MLRKVRKRWMGLLCGLSPKWFNLTCSHSSYRELYVLTCHIYRKVLTSRSELLKYARFQKSLLA